MYPAGIVTQIPIRGKCTRYMLHGERKSGGNSSYTYVRKRQEWSRTTGMEAREKEFLWDYAAVFCVLLKDRSDPGIGLLLSDSDESNLRDVFPRHELIGLPRRRCVGHVSFCSRGGYEERILISIHYQLTRTAHFILFLFPNKRCERMHRRRIAIVSVDLSNIELPSVCR